MNDTSHQIALFLRAGPHEPKATRAEVLEIACSLCAAEPGELCDVSFPRVSFIGIIFRGFDGIHLRRYLDRTHDPR